MSSTPVEAWRSWVRSSGWGVVRKRYGYRLQKPWKIETPEGIVWLERRDDGSLRVEVTADGERFGPPGRWAWVRESDTRGVVVDLYTACECKGEQTCERCRPRLEATP